MGSGPRKWDLSHHRILMIMNHDCYDVLWCYVSLRIHTLCFLFKIWRTLVDWMVHRMERIYPWSRRFKLFFHDSLEVFNDLSISILRFFLHKSSLFRWSTCADHIAVNFGCLLVVGLDLSRFGLAFFIISMRFIRCFHLQRHCCLSLTSSWWLTHTERSGMTIWSTTKQ